MSLFQSILGGKAQQKEDGLFSAANPFRRAANLSEPVAAQIAAPAAPVAAKSFAEDVPPTATVKSRKKSKLKQQLEAVPAAGADDAPGVEATPSAQLPLKAQHKKRKAASVATETEDQVQPKQQHEKAKKAKKAKKQPAADEDGAATETAEAQAPAATGGVKQNAKKRRISEVVAGGAENSLAQIKAAVLAAQEAEARHGANEGKAASEGDELLKDLSDAAHQPEPAAPGNQQAKLTPEQEAEQLERTIFVGNLPTSLTRKSLKAIFSQYGAVQSVRLRSVPIRLDKKLPRRAAILAGRVSGDRGTAHAYVVFKEAAAAAGALQHNMTEVDGLHIRVDRASRPSKEGTSSGVEYDRTKSVFVGNLAFDIEDEDVIRFFNEAGGGEDSVTAVRVVRDAETNLGKGFAFVLFATTQGARMAVARDGAELRGRPVRVSRVSAKRRSQPPKAAAPSPASGQQESGAARRLAVKAERSAGWQGLRTKGRDKLVSGTASRAPRPPNATASGKAGRPGVGGRSGGRAGRVSGRSGRGRGRGGRGKT